MTFTIILGSPNEKYNRRDYYLTKLNATTFVFIYNNVFEYIEVHSAEVRLTRPKEDLLFHKFSQSASVSCYAQLFTYVLHLLCPDVCYFPTKPARCMYLVSHSSPCISTFFEYFVTSSKSSQLHRGKLCQSSRYQLM